MPKTTQTPGEVLQSFIDEYQINPFFLSNQIKVAYQSVTNIIKGKARITVPMALRLGQFFGNSPKFWIDIQSSSEIDELSTDKKFLSVIKSISKIEKPKNREKAEVKSVKRKHNSISEKRKKASKVPGSKSARGKKSRS